MVDPGQGIRPGRIHVGTRRSRTLEVHRREVNSPRLLDKQSRERMVLPGNADRREVAVNGASHGRSVPVFSFFLLLFH